MKLPIKHHKGFDALRELWLDITYKPKIVQLPEPKPSDWTRAIKLLNHIHGCRCSTCRLAAGLGRAIRDQKGLA
jgi:hypothetical protein